MRGGAAFEGPRTAAVFLNEREFAQRCLWRPRQGTAAEIVGIFQDPFNQDTLVEAGLETSQPRLRCASAELPEIGEGDVVVIPAEDPGDGSGRRTWVVRGVEPDGTGFTFLKLSEV